jgi:hypothetical protein
MFALFKVVNRSKMIVLVSAALGASVAGWIAGCATDTSDTPVVTASDPAAARAEAMLSGSENPFAHVLTSVQTAILRVHGTLTAIAGQRTVHVDPLTCTKIVTQVYNVAFVAQGASTTGEAAVTCTGTCHGESCTSSGCTPSGGQCSGDVRCEGQGCTDPSCATSISSDNGLYGGIAEVQGAGG